MTGIGRWVAAVFLTAVVIGGVALLSNLTLPAAAPTGGVLHLDWRLRGEEAGPCTQVARESEDLPAHMRNPDACSGALPDYNLRLWIDGELRLDEVVRGGGIRGDRPLTVYRGLPLEPGERQVRVEFVRADGEPDAVALRLEEPVTIRTGEVQLLVRQQDTGDLAIRRPVS
ncbi:MAG: hypothetical protein WD960_11015 [Gemmatimonadota bacterium]